MDKPRLRVGRQGQKPNGAFLSNNDAGFCPQLFSREKMANRGLEKPKRG